MEIRGRATLRMGELVRDLDTAEREGAPGIYRLPDNGKSKADAIAAAGLSRTEAHRLQEIAGPREQRAQVAAAPIPLHDGLQ